MNVKRETQTTKAIRDRALAATEFLKRFAHPNRLLIACTLIEGERSVGELEALLGIKQPALSQQLAELREAGIVESRREVKQVFYRISDPRALALMALLHQYFCGGLASASATKRFDVGTSVAPEKIAAAARPPAHHRTSEAARFARVRA
ncbi:MAG TPA: metalloregulator ArsR/SmtB family transcription factor [Rhizomicrobium sp.]